MAKSNSVWGIEIGQSALKALRCSLDGDQVVAEAFDYIEYPKILSQPEADAKTLVHEALETFIKRNDLAKTRVALSVAGQNGLAKFFKPPPVELKKVQDIVKYEAKQQIPFDLDDVVWDYQLMAGGDISDGFALESEVGLFAMKRDAVLRTLEPLKNVDLEIDLLQLAPLSIYNAVTYDRGLLADPDATYDPEHPPKSTVILAMGTDATDLIVTNGFRVWQRSMPLGGNHFTRQLAKDLKLTFAKAEHLKKNAMEADDPKLVFQAMRPIFNDLVTEVQRSMGFFRSINKQAEIGSILMLGNTTKLSGLSQYLSKNLAIDVEVLDSFKELSGDEVLGAQAFRDHLPSFGPVFGLCLQALGKGPMGTNLVPQEVLKERLIRAKKPWAVAAAAVLMMGFAGNLFSASSRYSDVAPERWDQAIQKASTLKSTSDTEISDHGSQMARVELLTKLGDEVSGNRDRRLLWMEVLSAIYQALEPTNDFDLANLPDPNEVPFNQRTTIHINTIETKYYEDLSSFLNARTLAKYESNRKTRLERLGKLEVPAEGEEGSEVGADASAGSADATVEGEGGNAGYVIQIEGYHFHNGDEYAMTGDEREEYILKTLIDTLEEGSATLPLPDGSEMEFTYKEIGFSNPFIASSKFLKDFKVPNPEFAKANRGAAGGMGGGPGMGGGGPGMGGGGPGSGGGRSGNSGDEPKIKPFFDAPKLEFTVQMVWREKPLQARLEAKKAAEEAAAAAAEAAALEAGESTPGY